MRPQSADPGIVGTRRLRGERYESTRQAWEEIWARADVPRELATMCYPRAQEILRAYLPSLPRDGVILEAGSGLGAVLLTLQPLGYRVHGMDYALAPALAAEFQHAGARHETGNGSSLAC